MKKVSFIIVWLLLGMQLLHAGPRIQLALLLDTSNSMDGLIDQAKSQLWKVVNEFATLSYDGQPPRLEIALFEYGNDGLERTEGFVRLVSPLSEDLDRISESLFGLTTNGGSEFCGWVIGDAVKQLNWSDDKDALKIIFIAGNESFEQGQISFRETCRNAIGNGIIVNTIFCGDGQEGIKLHWKEGAELADGKYLSIDQNQAIAHISAPQDTLINSLNQALNQTYISYGARGSEMKSRQLLQDANAMKMGASVQADRAMSKSTAMYRNSSWDLVDAYREQSVDIEELPASSLPETMQHMNAAQKKAYVENMSQERKSLQEQIRLLSLERQKYFADKQQNQGGPALQDAMLKAVREQASSHGFSLRIQ